MSANMSSSPELRTDSRSPSRFAGQRVHFIGIGGSGMSGLARMLLDFADHVDNQSGSLAPKDDLTMIIAEVK